MIQKEELISKIMEMADLSNDEKAEIIGSLRKAKKYGLVWEDHPEDAEERLKSAFPVLREVKELAINSSPRGGQEGAVPNHILIEGDNLEALMALSYTHEGKVDVIYIDPPYNTGNKDFIYNDCIVDSEDGYRHSKWLSFMEKRLRLAKKLLSDKGVIFISIDDNEQANLKLLCDEVFESSNHLATFIWKKRQMVDSRTKNGASKDHDYLICYRRTEDARIKGKLADMSKYSNPDNDPRGPWMSADMTGLATPEQRPNLHYDLTNPITGVVYKCPPTGWRYERSRMASLVENGEVLWPPKPEGRPRRKKFVKDLTSDTTGLSTVLETVFSTQGTREVRDIFEGKEVFDFPKPVDLLKLILDQSLNRSSLVLDFFAGSGTTLHATMQLNAEDGGHRQCILVTNNENNICRDVTYERNKRVIQGYTTPKGVAVEGLNANKLRYYTIDFLPREYTNEAKRELMRAATDMLCIKEGIYNEVREFCGMKFKPSILRYFRQDTSTGSAQVHQMLLIFDERVIEHIVPMMATIEGKLKIYVFSNGAYAYEDEFQELRDKVELCALPEALLQVYKQVLPQNDDEVRI